MACHGDSFTFTLPGFQEVLNSCLILHHDSAVRAGDTTPPEEAPTAGPWLAMIGLAVSSDWLGSGCDLIWRQAYYPSVHSEGLGKTTKDIKYVIGSANRNHYWRSLFIQTMQNLDLKIGPSQMMWFFQH
jgi:hypothetical protein